jgi:hypothetical protein
LERRAIESMVETIYSNSEISKKLDEAQLKDLDAKIGQLTIESLRAGVGWCGLKSDQTKSRKML